MEREPCLGCRLDCLAHLRAPGEGDEPPRDTACSSEEFTDTAQSGAQLDLACSAVEPDVECAGKGGGCLQALRQAGGVESVTPGDEEAKIVTTHGVSTG